MTLKNSLRILYDHQIFEGQQYGGISRYFYELINEFIQSSDIKPAIPIAVNSNNYIKNLHEDFLTPKIPINSAINQPIKADSDASLVLKFSFSIKYWIYCKKRCNISDRNKRNSIKNLLDGHYDIFHPTYYDPYFLPFLKGKPFVLTVHDLIHERYPELFPLDDITIHNKNNLIHKADHIIAVSKNTKDDIIRYYNVPSERISVIYHGSNVISNFDVEISEFIDTLPEKYILYVGARESYKNFFFIIEVLAPFFKKEKSLKLLCFGGENVSNSEKVFIQNLGLQDNIIYIHGSDNQLICAYQQALALIYPSQYEGFGIPIIEAFKQGCPVIASNIPPFMEIGKDAIHYFDPKNPISIRESLERITHDEMYRSELIMKGRNEAKNFSWKKTALETADVYQKIINP